MLPPALTNYLKDCQARSLPFAQVEKLLQASGYPDDLITAARNWYNSQPSSMPSTPPSPSPRSRSQLPFKKPLVLTILLLIFLAFTTSVSAYLISTDVIPLPSDSPIKQFAQRLVAALPFFPKTPRQVLTQTLAAHQQVSRHQFDLSLAVTAPNTGINQILGTDKLDFRVTGYADYTNFQQPLFSLQARLGPDLSLQVRKPDTHTYLHLDSLPVYISAPIGVNPEDVNPILSQNWLVLDSTLLDTPARQSLNDSPPTPLYQSYTNTATLEVIKQLLDEDIIPILTQSLDRLDNRPVYKIQFHPDQDLINHIGSKLDSASGRPAPTSQSAAKLTDYIQDFQLTLWIGKSDYYVYKSEVQTTLVLPSGTYGFPSLTLPSTFSIAAVLQLSDFGQTQDIAVPSPALTPEQFYQLLAPALTQGTFPGLNPVSPFSQSRNTKRRADLYALTNGLYQHITENRGIYPSQIPSSDTPISSSGADICPLLVPDYIGGLPVDPSLNLDNDFSYITDCNSSYDTGYTLYMDSEKRLVVSAPLAELGEVITVIR